MSGVTREMLLEYIQRKGGRVKNVDLVRHFRKHLLYDDPHKKGMNDIEGLYVLFGSTFFFIYIMYCFVCHYYLTVEILCLLHTQVHTCTYLMLFIYLLSF